MTVDLPKKNGFWKFLFGMLSGYDLDGLDNAKDFQGKKILHSLTHLLLENSLNLLCCKQP